MKRIRKRKRVQWDPSNDSESDSEYDDPDSDYDDNTESESEVTARESEGESEGDTDDPDDPEGESEDTEGDTDDPEDNEGDTDDPEDPEGESADPEGESEDPEDSSDPAGDPKPIRVVIEMPTIIGGLFSTHALAGILGGGSSPQETHRGPTKRKKKKKYLFDDTDLDGDLEDPDLRPKSRLSRRIRQQLNKANLDMEHYEKNLARNGSDHSGLTLLERVQLATAIPMPLKHEIVSTLNGGVPLERNDERKYHHWVKTLLKIPTRVARSEVDLADPVKVTHYLTAAKRILDSAVHGHAGMKEEILDFLAGCLRQDAAEAQATGNVLALLGSPGTGKTKLVRNGICAALGRPFHQISFGGLNDPHVLTGHAMTYVGARMGRIAEIMINSGIQNPVVYLDEIDKIGDDFRAMEVYGVLTHLLDPEQNKHFVDEYLGHLAPLDLSKVLFVIALNNLDAVDAVVRDRLKVIRVAPPSVQDKIIIAERYVIPELAARIGFDPGRVHFSEAVLKYLLYRKTTAEDGVRQFRRNLETLLQRVNTMDLLGDHYKDLVSSDDNMTPAKLQRSATGSYTITESFIDSVLDKLAGNNTSPKNGIEFMYS